MCYVQATCVFRVHLRHPIILPSCRLWCIADHQGLVVQLPVISRITHTPWLTYGCSEKIAHILQATFSKVSCCRQNFNSESGQYKMNRNKTARILYFRGPLYKRGLALIPAWMSNYTHYITWACNYLSMLGLKLIHDIKETLMPMCRQRLCYRLHIILIYISLIPVIVNILFEIYFAIPFLKSTSVHYSFMPCELACLMDVIKKFYLHGCKFLWECKHHARRFFQKYYQTVRQLSYFHSLSR